MTSPLARSLVHTTVPCLKPFPPVAFTSLSRALSWKRTFASAGRPLSFCTSSKTVISFPFQNSLLSEDGPAACLEVRPQPHVALGIEFWVGVVPVVLQPADDGGIFAPARKVDLIAAHVEQVDRRVHFGRVKGVDEIDEEFLEDLRLEENLTHWQDN